MAETGILMFILNTLEYGVGVKFKKSNLNLRNSFDAIMIILATYFIFPIWSGYLDIFANAVPEGIINEFAIGGFRFAFLISAIWLIVIAMFSKARLSIVKFLALLVPGLVLGVVLTFLLTQAVLFLQTVQFSVWKLDSISLFIMSIYPLLFSYFVRTKVNQFMKPKERPVCPPPPKKRFERSVYVE